MLFFAFNCLHCYWGLNGRKGDYPTRIQQQYAVGKCSNNDKQRNTRKRVPHRNQHLSTPSNNSLTMTISRSINLEMEESHLTSLFEKFLLELFLLLLLLVGTVLSSVSSLLIHPYRTVSLQLEGKHVEIFKFFILVFLL